MYIDELKTVFVVLTGFSQIFSMRTSGDSSSTIHPPSSTINTSNELENQDNFEANTNISTHPIDDFPDSFKSTSIYKYKNNLTTNYQIVINQTNNSDDFVDDDKQNETKDKESHTKCMNTDSSSIHVLKTTIKPCANMPKLLINQNFYNNSYEMAALKNGTKSNKLNLSSPRVSKNVDKSLRNPFDSVNDVNIRLLGFIPNSRNELMNFKAVHRDYLNAGNNTLHSTDKFKDQSAKTSLGSREPSNIKNVNSNILCDFKNLDICGSCVNNASETKSYIDDCGVCGGSSECNFCSNSSASRLDQCGKCLKPEDNRWNNCTKTSNMFPTVIDLVSIDKYGSVFLKGVGLSEFNLPNLECFIQNTGTVNKFLNIINISLQNSNIHLKFEVDGSESDYKVHCNTSNEEAILGVYNLTIINSNSLSLLLLTPSSVILGEAVQFFVIVRGMSTLAEVICFIKTKNNMLVAALPSDKIQGNSLITNITCPIYSPKCADDFVFGVAYTYDAIPKIKISNTKQLVVKTGAPELKKSYFLPDLRQVVFEFTDIIDGPSNCSSLFTPETVQLLGMIPVCLFSGNVLQITLGQTAFLRSVNDIEFTPGQIKSACGIPSNAPAFLSYDANPIKITHSSFNKPSYKLIGPSLVCVNDEKYNSRYLLMLMNRKTPLNDSISSSSSQFIIRSAGTEQIHYKWTLRYYFEAEGSDMEVGIRQRRNLLVWLSVRELEKMLSTVTKDEATIDNSLLVPKVKYVLSVVGQNQIGESGENVSTTFELMSSSTKSSSDFELLKMSILGSSVIDIEADNWLEAIIMSSCSNDLLTTIPKFSWNIDNSKDLDFTTQRGPKLFIPAGTLKGNSLYNVSCKLKVNNLTLSETVFNFQTKTPKLKVAIGVSDLFHGTGQTLQLWAAVDKTYVSQNIVEFIWSCNYNEGFECYLPYPNTSSLIDLHSNEFKKKVLTLKPGSLKVGTYTFRVTALFKGENIKALSSPTKVNVIPGEPPVISIEKYSLFSVNPNNDLSIVAIVSHLQPGCRLNWEFLRVSHSSYIEITSVIPNTTYDVPLDKEMKSKEFSLVIPGKLYGCEGKNCNLLQENTNYTLLLSVFCSAKLYSSATTKFQTGNFPKIRELGVAPRKGIGLITEFQFSTKPAYTSEEYQPLVYSFGYKVLGEKPVIVYTSSNWINHKTVLPSLSTELGTPTTIETFLKVCNYQRICSLKHGPSVYTTSPKSISPEILNALRMVYSRHLIGGEYNEAFSSAFSFLKTLKATRDVSTYNNLSQFIESEILEQIDTVSRDLENKPTIIIKSVVSLLDTITSTIQYLLPSDNLLENLVSLKKKILRIVRDSNKSTSELRSMFTESSYRKKLLHMKHELSGSLFWKARFQRQINSILQSREEILTVETVKTMLEASEVAILNFTQQESAISEVRELLQNVDYFVSSLCDQTFNDGKLIYIGTKVAEISVKHIHPDVSYTEEIPMPECSSGCLSSKASIKLGKKLTDIFPDYDNICYASLIYPSDYLSKVYNSNSETSLRSDLRLSNVYSIKLMTQSDFEPKTEEEMFLVEMKIPINNFTPVDGLTLKCFVWIMERREWHPDLCESHIIEDGGRFIRCQCPVNHYISVFAVNDTAELDKSTELYSFLEGEQNLNHVTAASDSIRQLTTKPDWELVSLAYHKITFRIEEDYRTIVGKKSKEFTEVVKAQLIEKFNIPAEMFRNVSVYPGTIMVSMQLVNSTSVSVSDILPTLVRALNFGELKLTGISGQILNIPPQLLQISEKLVEVDDSYEALLFLIIGFMICTAVFITFTIAVVILKRNRDKLTEDVEETDNDLNFPKYRELYFEQSIDGSESSLNQYRRPVQIQFEAGSHSSNANGEDSGISIVPEMTKNFIIENGEASSRNVHYNNPESNVLPGSAVGNI